MKIPLKVSENLRSQKLKPAYTKQIGLIVVEKILPVFVWQRLTKLKTGGVLSNAVKRPDEVGALCILNTWAWPPDTFTKTFGRVLGGFVGKQLIERRNFFATTLVRRQMHHSKQKTQAVFDAYAAPFPDKTARYPTWVFPREILKNDDALKQLEQDLAKLKGKPTEMVWGMEDPGFGKETIIARWHQALGEVPTTRIQEANHFLQEDQIS